MASRKLREASGEREADNRTFRSSAMFSWAVDRGLLRRTISSGFKRLYHSDRSEIIWLPEHIAAFMSVAPIEMQRALIFGCIPGKRARRPLRHAVVGL